MPARAARKALVATLLDATRRHPLRTALAVLLLIMAKMATVAVPLALKQIIDGVGAASGAAAPPATLPVALLVGYALLRFTATLFGELRDRVFAPVLLGTVAATTRRAFEHLHRMGARFHAIRRTGSLIRDVERGTSGMSLLLGVALFTLVPTLVEIGAVGAVLATSYDLRFTAILVVTFALYAVFTVSYTERRAIHQRAMNRLDSTANGRLVDSLLNHDTVKFHAREAYESQRLAGLLGQWTDAGVANQRALTRLHLWQSAIIATGVAAVMLLAGASVLDHRMTVGDLVLVNAYVLQVCLPLNALGFVFRQARDAVIDAERLFALLALAPEISEDPAAPALVVKGGEVRFEGVQFAYEPQRPVLHGVDLVIPAGRTVAVVGGSGSGKSTLARLLFRVHELDGGRILVDGQDVRRVSTESLRRAIGIVPQDTTLFNDTIGFNIAYGRLEATQAQIAEAARAARIAEFIEALPERYETMVGERGVKLSGGERQRVAIARALLKDPPILVLDEATSALDTRSERAIQRELARLSHARTTLVIAHRLSTVVDADEIVVLEQGRVVERGRHESLLASGGAYARMWSLQRQQTVVERDVWARVRSEVDIAAELTASVQATEAAAAAGGVSLHTRISTLATMVALEPDAVQATIRALLLNAIRVTPPGGRVDCCVDRVGGSLSLSVTDGRSLCPPVAGAVPIEVAAATVADTTVDDRIERRRLPRETFDPEGLRVLLARSGGDLRAQPAGPAGAVRWVAMLTPAGGA